MDQEIKATTLELPVFRVDADNKTLTGGILVHELPGGEIYSPLTSEFITEHNLGFEFTLSGTLFCFKRKEEHNTPEKTFVNEFYWVQSALVGDGFYRAALKDCVFLPPARLYN